MRGKQLNSGIRGGLWEEQHFQGMGPAIWLFGWLIHRQTRERNGVGLVLAGSPLTYQMISQDTGIAERTLKRWMARLGRAGYVQVTHTAHKRMVIHIAKAKKFGPQQLGFPQKQLGFPQAPFFAPNSKGPVWALDIPSKGPTVAQKNAAQLATSSAKAESCTQAQTPHREFKPERKENTKQHVVYSGAALKSLQNGNTLPKTSQADSRRVSTPQLDSYSAHQWPDRRALREMELRAELRVGTGPEIRRE